MIRVLKLASAGLIATALPLAAFAQTTTPVAPAPTASASHAAVPHATPTLGHDAKTVAKDSTTAQDPAKTPAKAAHTQTPAPTSKSTPGAS